MFLILAGIVLVLLFAVADAETNVSSGVSYTEMRCPTCGSPARNYGRSWECPWCGDSGRS